MNYCLQKYTTHQYAYFIYYLFHDNFKNAKLSKSKKAIKRYMQKQFLLYFIQIVFYWRLI